MIETSLIDNLIIGRIPPHIYAFRTNTVPDYLKVGDTYRPVSVRIDEWRKHYSNLVHDAEWEWVAKTKNGKYFRDFAVHYYLEHIKRFHRLLPNDIEGLPYYSKEFFKHANPTDIDEALLDIELNASLVGSPYQYYSEDRLPADPHYERTETYPLRPNQKDTVKRFNLARKNGRRKLLMYAVMRFGKSFTSMWCATEMQAKVVLIVSAKADVKREWKKTVESHVHFEDYTFLDSQALLANNNAISDLLRNNKRAAVFLTLQDLNGDNIKEKHKDIFRNKIDLLIVDETHFAARADEYGKILREANLTPSQVAKELEKGDEDFEKLEQGLTFVKQLTIDTSLHLSGTPYRILMGSEFQPEDIIAFYQFTDIIDDKETWDKEHLDDENIQEWDNPYYGFPQMVRFAFNLNDASRRKLEELKAQGKTASLSELFSPVSISKDTRNHNNRRFKHEQEVLDLLKIIDGTKDDNNILSFLNYEKIKEGKMCRHIVCVLPYCASCDAFEALINANKTLFKHLSEYEIINISGWEGIYKDIPTEQIPSIISKFEAEDKKTLSLTVNRMLTGSTVPEWDTMLFLKDVSSPQEYDQAVFRLQNQYIKLFKDESGDTIKYVMKPQTLLVDFDPNRVFIMQEQKSKIYNVNTEERGNEELEERIRKELKISPVIVINSGKMCEIEPTDIMDAVRKYSANRTIMDEAKEIPTDFNLLQDPEIQLLIQDLEPINASKGINEKAAKNSKEDDDDFKIPEHDDVDEDDTAKTSHKETTHKEEVDDADKRLATYFAQILFYTMLSDDHISSLKDVLLTIKSSMENQRIARNVGIAYKKLKYLYHHLNPFILQDLDYKIQNIDDLSFDTTLQPIERVERALQKFGRLSISEIVTPKTIADEVVAMLPQEEINSETKFLDIASKQGEFTCAIYRRFGEKVKDNIWALPTSPLTYEFTRKVYKILNLPIDHIYTAFYSYDLIRENKDTYINILKEMQFNVIIGNPPYQENDKGNATSDAAAPIYQKFACVAKEVTNDFVSIIMPSKWMVGGRSELSAFLRQMKEDYSIKILRDFQDDRKIFPDTHNDGGICYILWDKHKKIEALNYEYISLDGTIVSYSSLKNPYSDFIIRDTRVIPILDKIFADEDTYLEENRFSNIVSKTKPFGIRKDIFNSPGNYPTSKLSSTKFRGSVKLFGVIGKKGAAKRTFGYVNSTILSDKYKALQQYKIFFTTTYSTNAIEPPSHIVALKGEACTETFLVIGPFQSKEETENCSKYMQTNFFKFLLYLGHGTMQVNKKVFSYIPIQNFTTNSDIDWTKSVKEIDEILFEKYQLSQNEKDLINAMIKDM